MKLVSWNVNGLKSAIEKGFIEVLNTLNADIFCIQETKVQEEIDQLKNNEYYQYWNYSKKKGYSGTATFCKKQPVNVTYGINNEKLDYEGRTITLEFEDVYIVNTYTPCIQKNIQRQNYREEWDEEFFKYIQELEQKKDVIICGDFNVAYQKIDLGNINNNFLSFSDEERHQFKKILDMGFVDTFRYKNPNHRKYTWWRNNNRDDGCRLDYFLISEGLKSNIIATQIRNDIGGSDHCPIVLKIKI